MKKILLITSILGAAVLIVGLTAGLATASLGGISGKYKVGCGACHGKSGPGVDGAGKGGAVIITDTNGEALQGTQKAGAKETYVVTLEAALPGAFGGFNAAVEDSSGNKAGTMAAGQNSQTKANNSEVVHAGPAPVIARNVNVRVWTFDWTAPATPGTYTMYVSALAANGIGAGTGAGPDANDFWYQNTYTITVTQ